MSTSMSTSWPGWSGLGCLTAPPTYLSLDNDDDDDDEDRDEDEDEEYDEDEDDNGEDQRGGRKIIRGRARSGAVRCGAVRCGAVRCGPVGSVARHTPCPVAASLAWTLYDRRPYIPYPLSPSLSPIPPSIRHESIAIAFIYMVLM